MKQARGHIKSGLLRFIASLPTGARRSIARDLVEDGMIDYRDFIEIARRYHIQSLRVAGDYGTFQSSINDLSILGTYAKTGTWANQTNRLLSEFFSRVGGGTYIDVGANIGLTVVPVARRADVSCYAIEAEPSNFRNLVENLKLNSEHGNVTALEFAAYASKTTLEFEIDTIGNLGDHRIHVTDSPGEYGETNRKTIKVAAAPLDDLVPQSDGPLAVKIDTQGAEPYVVAGGRKTLGRADLLIMEFWPYGMRRLDVLPDIIFDYLRSQFTRASLSRESQPIELPAPINDVIEKLRHFSATEANVGPSYLDIIAYR